MKSVIKELLKSTPYRIVRRSPPNRFQAVEDSLVSLSRRGYRPRRIIDGGANVGSFATLVLKLFPDAVVHVIEPQPGCQADLESIKAEFGNRVIRHAIALCAPENEGSSLSLATDDAQRSTGAHVTTSTVDTGGHCVSIPCETLDSALAPFRKGDDHSFIKLDLQGYELHALRGATDTLATTDVVLSEVSFFAQAYEPPIAELIAFLASQGFELYDVVALYARPRDDRPRQGDFLFVRRDCELAADKLWD
jgi:FkbM family methyltransferase